MPAATTRTISRVSALTESETKMLGSLPSLVSDVSAVLKSLAALVAVKEKQRARRHWRSQPCVANQSTYKITCTNARLHISAAKSIHRQRLRARLQAGCANDKEWWKTLKQASRHGRNSGIPTIIDRDGN